MGEIVTIQGTIEAIGDGTKSGTREIREYLRIGTLSGEGIMFRNVALWAEVASYIAPGIHGTFIFEKLGNKQVLHALKTEGRLVNTFDESITDRKASFIVLWVLLLGPWVAIGLGTWLKIGWLFFPGLISVIPAYLLLAAIARNLAPGPKPDRKKFETALNGLKDDSGKA